MIESQKIYLAKEDIRAEELEKFYTKFMESFTFISFSLNLGICVFEDDPHSHRPSIGLPPMDSLSAFYLLEMKQITFGRLLNRNTKTQNTPYSNTTDTILMLLMLLIYKCFSVNSILYSKLLIYLKTQFQIKGGRSVRRMDIFDVSGKR